MWDEHKHKHKKNRMGTAWNKRELSTSISTRKRNFFHSLCLRFSHACAYFTIGNLREVSTSRSKMIPPSWISFQISSNVTALAYALFSCACFTRWECRKLMLVLIAQVEPRLNWLKNLHFSLYPSCSLYSGPLSSLSFYYCYFKKKNFQVILKFLYVNFLQLKDCNTYYLIAWKTNLCCTSPAQRTLILLEEIIC